MNARAVARRATIAANAIAPFAAGALAFAGVMAGVAGAHLALAHAGTFAEGMSAGRGFIAIAIVVLGRWRPLPVFAAALFFGSASAHHRGNALKRGEYLVLLPILERRELASKAVVQ